MNRNAYQLELPAGHVTTCVNINDVDLFAMEVIFLHVKLFIKAKFSPLDFDFILYLHFDYRL